MSYIRTKDRICTLSEAYWAGIEDEIIAEADTIEELIMPNDMLFVGEDKVQMPIFVESIEYLKAWLFCHDIYKIKEFYIKVGNDWHLVAKMNNEGVLELI